MPIPEPPTTRWDERRDRASAPGSSGAALRDSGLSLVAYALARLAME